MDSSAPGRLYFNTGTLPERDRFPIFCEEVVRAYTALDLRTEIQAQFHASLELRRVGAIDIGHLDISPVASARTSSHVHDGDDSLLISLLVRGQAFQTQCEDDQILRAGDAVICDCGYPGEFNFVTESRFWNLKIPRNKIAPLFPGVTRFAGTRLDKAPFARALLFGYLTGTHSIDIGDAGSAIRLYDQHLIDLVALALGAEGDARTLAEKRGVRTVRRSAVLMEIARRSGDNGLSAATVARTLGITPRYVHLLLEDTGQSFSCHVLQRRLDRAAALLREPRWRHRRIADIAAAAGFTDLSYFNRTFRRRYGATPSDMREAAHQHG